MSVLTLKRLRRYEAGIVVRLSALHSGPALDPLCSEGRPVTIEEAVAGDLHT